MGEKKEGSYHIEDWGESSLQNPEIQRLKDQVDITLDKEKIIWKHLDIKDGMSILEPGCGPGWLTKELLKMYPNSKVTGVEYNAHMVHVFNLNMSIEEKKRASIVEGSIIETSFADNTFDVAIVRAVLQHIPNYEDALKEIARLLKPGGLIYILDRDDSFPFVMEPEMVEYREFGDKVTKLYQEKMGGHPKISKYLPRKLKNLGFTSIDYHAVAMHSDVTGLEDIKKHNNREVYLPFLKQNVITEDEVTKLVNDADVFLNNDESLTIGLGFVTTGIKGAINSR